MIRRAVIDAKRSGKSFQLKLECGHIVTRRDAGRKSPPKKTYCDDCEMLLDRCKAQEGWFMARAVRGRYSMLKLFEREGLVDSSKAFHTATLYWKVR